MITECVDRGEVSPYRALAMAIAYKNCGMQQDAETWARKVIELLQCAGILKGE